MRDVLAKIAKFVLPGLRKVSHRLVRGPGHLHCVACNSRVHDFQPLPAYYSQQLQAAGWPYGLNATETCNYRQYTCPYCGAADRDRLIALYLDELLPDFTTAATVIDFAPSDPLTRYIRRTLHRHRLMVQYRTADLFASGVDDRVDITDMPGYASGSIDLFLCSHVLEHVSDDRKAMRELRRILKPTGRGVVLVPIVLGLHSIDEDPTVTDEGKRWQRFGQGDHVRLYSKDGFVARLMETGFQVHQLGVAHFGAARFEDQGIADRSVLYMVEPRKEDVSDQRVTGQHG